MSKEKISKGFKCKTCKTFNEFEAYVFAHWDLELSFTCECKSEFLIFQGRATLVRKGEK